MSLNVTKFRVAIYGVLVENGHVLMTNTRVPSGIITNFPGGGLEHGESPSDAVVREFWEETAISVTLDHLLFCTQAFQQNPEYPHEQLIHIYYKVSRLAGEVSLGGNGDDVESTVWVSPNEIHHYPVLPVDLEFVLHASFRALFLSR
jgi:8-oxo-dGTP pyrophosphatase MutT (NUDIX family)